MSQILTYVKTRTIIGSGRDSDTSNMNALVEKMYAAKVLRMECSEFRRVGFNEKLNATLLDKTRKGKVMEHPGRHSNV